MSTPEQLFADLLAREPARPFVTYYDEATGERSELSARSLANWVAKTHFLLVDELGLGAGDTAALVLPLHWISLAPLLGSLTAGLALTAGGTADVAFTAPGAPVDAPDRYVIAPQSASVGLRQDLPDGALDYVAAVRPHADAWPGVRFGGSPADTCWDGRTREEVADRAVVRAAELGLGAGARLLCTRDWAGPGEWLDTVLAPLAVGGSVVYVRGASDEVLARRAAQERVTATLS